MLGRPIWYELLTTDMKAAEAFYTNVVGWSTGPVPGSPQPYTTWQRADGVSVGGVMNIPQGMNFPPHWEMYVAVPDLDAAIAKVETLGGSSLGPLIEIPHVGRMRTMMDPQGAIFAMHQPVSGLDPEAEPKDGDASWHELYADDAPTAARFYQALFGWTSSGEVDMGPAGTYYMYGRNWPLVGMMSKTKEMAQVPTAWLIYFHVDGAGAGAARIKANGGQVTLGPIEVPGGDWIVNGIDPQGAHFALHSKKA
jgi:predicted enzyme related to lactoylglutathione lyase